MKYMNLYLLYLKYNFKVLSIYNFSFLIGSFSFILSSFGLLLSIFILFNVTDEIGGFSLYEMIFLYGFVSLSRAIWNFTMMNTINISEYVRNGEIDLFLIRPVNTYFHIINKKMDLESIGEIFYSIIIVIISVISMKISINIWSIPLFILLLISSVLCYGAIHLAANSLSFWIINVNALNYVLWRMDELTRYPINIYGKIIQLTITIIPFSFIGYYPSIILLGLTNQKSIIILSILIGPISFYIAYKYVWELGLKNHTSTGS